MLWGEKWKGWQSPGVEPRTTLGWATSALQLSHDSRITTNPHNPVYVSREKRPTWLKPEVSWVQLLVTADLFSFLYFHSITSNSFIFSKMLWATAIVLNVAVTCRTMCTSIHVELGIHLELGLEQSIEHHMLAWTKLIKAVRHCVPARSLDLNEQAVIEHCTWGPAL